MQITITKTGRVRFHTGKFKFNNHISFGDVLVLVLLSVWFTFDVVVWFLK